MRARCVKALFAGLLMAASSWAQIADLDPDWKELEVAPPAKFNTARLVPIDMPPYVSVRVGIDPDSLQIGQDGVIRYVVVAVTPGGNANAMFEGIWCLKGEVKTYARYGSDGQWNPVADAQWMPLNGNQRSMHALAFARQAACDGRAASANSAAEIIRKLRQNRFGGLQK